ncbi:hypothetical protein [uncultured Thiodictyon sp.]|uniref:hypothetical protein n=1 Tax=uncultured Thiodictyon sp. TaxID=1846217 RepID=UPI0025CE55DD|nr:hypothetical protein [uncultured Thiodictyon sp.]
MPVRGRCDPQLRPRRQRAETTCQLAFQAVGLGLDFGFALGYTLGFALGFTLGKDRLVGTSLLDRGYQIQHRPDILRGERAKTLEKPKLQHLREVD